MIIWEKYADIPLSFRASGNDLTATRIAYITVVATIDRWTLLSRQYTSWRTNTHIQP